MKFLLRISLVMFFTTAVAASNIALFTNHALADSDSGSGDDGNDGGGDTGDDGNEGGDDGGESGSGSGNSGSGSGNSGSGSGNSGSGSGNSGSGSGNSGSNNSYDNRSLAQVIRAFKSSKKGRFLDATKTRRKGKSYYKVTFIRPNGRLSTVFIKARPKKSKHRSKSNSRSRTNFNQERN